MVASFFWQTWHCISIGPFRILYQHYISITIKFIGPSPTGRFGINERTILYRHSVLDNRQICETAVGGIVYLLNFAEQPGSSTTLMLRNFTPASSFGSSLSDIYFATFSADALFRRK